MNDRGIGNRHRSEMCDRNTHRGVGGCARSVPTELILTPAVGHGAEIDLADPMAAVSRARTAGEAAHGALRGGANVEPPWVTSRTEPHSTARNRIVEICKFVMSAGQRLVTGIAGGGVLVPR